MKVLVTGGGGFIGGAVVRALLERGTSVRTLSRGDYPELEALGVEHRRADLGDLNAVTQAVQGCDAVIHTAAKAGVSGPDADYERANLLGTQHVLSACRAAGAGKLVYTSTPTVVHQGKALERLDERLPYATVFKNAYQRTKILAEKAVLAANGEALHTVALRPHLVWGPGDPHFLPRILGRIRRGRIALPGGGKALVDTTYIDNVTDAHLAALDALFCDTRRGACAGKPYFITNGEARPAGDIIVALAAAAGTSARVANIPTWLATSAAVALETTYRGLRLAAEPPLTRFTVEQMTTDHHFDISAAHRDLGWRPRISLDEGFERLRAAYRAPTERSMSSRVSARGVGIESDGV